MNATRLRRTAALLRPRSRDGCTADTLRCDFWNWGPAALRPECCTDHLRELAEFVHELLDRHGIVHWVDYGTLLGAVREGEFIAWDTDVDFGVFEKDLGAILALEPEVRAAGHVIDTSDAGVVRIALSPINEQHVDLFLWHEHDGLLRGDFNPQYDWPGLHDHTAFPPRYLEQPAVVPVYELQLPAPAPIHDFLVNHRYGSDYMVPARPINSVRMLPELGPAEMSPAVTELLGSIADLDARLSQLNYRSRLCRTSIWRRWQRIGLPPAPPADEVRRARKDVRPADRTETTDRLAYTLAALADALRELENPRPGDGLRRLGRRVRWLGGALSAKLRGEPRRGFGQP